MYFSRVSQYVFVPTKEEIFTLLDQHADTLEGDVKAPLVLVGNDGNKLHYIFNQLLKKNLQAVVKVLYLQTGLLNEESINIEMNFFSNILLDVLHKACRYPLL